MFHNYTFNAVNAVMHYFKYLFLNDVYLLKNKIALINISKTYVCGLQDFFGIQHVLQVNLSS